MTPQEAIEIITNIIQGDGSKVTVKQDEALSIVQRATEKTIRRKVRIIGSSAACPCCNEYVDNFFDHYFCQRCGQALDWS